MSSAERLSERRSADRRRLRRPAVADESWFGAFSSEVDTQVRDDELPDDEATEPASTGEEAAPSRKPGKPPDSRFLYRAAARVAESGQTAFERIYRAFIAARAALGLALAIALAVGGLFGLHRPRTWTCPEKWS